MTPNPIRIWSLSMRPTSIGLAVLVSIFLGDTILAITLGSKNAKILRECSRLKVQLDSLHQASHSLARKLMVQEALQEASRGRILPQHASILAEEIDRNAVLYHFDPLLILAVVLTESEGKVNAVGRRRSGEISGAFGVMQIQPATARQTAKLLGIHAPDSKSLMDPAFNLTVGVAYLLQMIHRYGNLRLGIMAFNVGASGLESGLRGQSDLPEGYYRKVYTKYQMLLTRLASPSPPVLGP